MVVTNHKLLQLRIGSLLFAAIFATVVYMDVNEYFMFPLFLLQLVSFLLALSIKRKRKEKSLVSISRSGTIALIILYTCAITLGVTVSMTTSRTLEAICSLLIYVVCLDAFMAIPFVLSFTDKTEWQSNYSSSGFGDSSSVNSTNGQVMTGYTDSSGCLPGCGTPSWPTDTYTSNPSNRYD